MADELDDSFFAEEPSDIDETESIFDDEIDELDEIVIENNDEGRSNRPFLISLLGLLGVGVGAFLCLGLTQFMGFGPGGEPDVSPEMLTATVQVAEIFATNDAVATQNVFVTQTIDARNAAATEQAIQPTNTPAPTETPVPTNSPVPAAASGGSTEGAEPSDDVSDTGSSTGDSDTSAEGNSGSDSDTSTDAGADSGTEDTSSAPAGGGTDSDTSADGGTDGSDTSGDQTALPETLPDTGFSIAGTLALAFGLLVLLFGSRRLRQA